MTMPQLEFVTSSHTSFDTWLRTTRNEVVSVDTETEGLDCWNDRLRMVQFGDVDYGFAIPVEGNELGRGQVAWALDYMRDSGRPLTAHRAKFDAQFLHNNGFDVSAIRDDSKASSHLIDSTCTGLKQAAARRFGDWVLEGETKLATIKRKNKWTWSTIPINTFEYWWYAALDPVLTSRLQTANMPVVNQHYRELYDMELDVWQMLAQAERRGLLVDLDYCWEQLEVLEEEMMDLEAKYADGPNLGSPSQLGEIFHAAGYKLRRTKKSEKWQVDEETLERIIAESRAKKTPNVLAEDALRYRRLNKNASTYFGAYLDKEVDGRIHTFIESLGARTGRMSSRDPNLQNVPKRVSGDYVRQAFVATPGSVLALADYRQIEYRIFASFAGEPDMIEAILNGEDLHAVTARIAYDDPSIDSDDPRRDIAKNANFAEIYMAGAAKFAATAGITVPEANAFKKSYHEKFRRVKPFSKAVLRYAQSNGLAVDTKFGRRIPVDAEKLYVAVNYMIQGTAADVLKRAIQRLSRTWLAEYFVLPIHDELIFDVPEELAGQAVKDIPEIMEDRETFDVPIAVDIKLQHRWGVKEEVAA